MKDKFFGFIKAALFTSTLIYILYNPFQITYHCQKAIEMCLRTVIPSLFVFTVFSNLLSLACARIKTMPKFLSGLSTRIFGLDTRLFLQCVFGFFAGAAPAVAGIETLFKNGKISKRSCENSIMLLPGCSIPFILTVAASSIGNTPIAYLLIFANISAVLTSFIILCKRESFFDEYKAVSVSSNLKNTEIFTQTVSYSMTSMINMCSFIIFFKVLSGVICDLISSFSCNNMLLTSAINGFFEITGGTVSASAVSGNEKIMVLCAICGFSGISIIFQVMSVCSKCGVSCKNFIYSRILCAILCPVFMLIFLMLFPISITCFSPFELSIQRLFTGNTKLFCRSFITGISVLTALFMMIIDKKHKKKD